VTETPPVELVRRLLVEYDRALAYTDALWRDLSDDEIRWRPHADFSPIGWHLGHQAAVAHFMVRNLTAAEPPIDAALDALMDSATPERERGDLPDGRRLAEYRQRAAERLHVRIGAIVDGQVGAPAQLCVVAAGLISAVTNHEYQHSQWIGEVRSEHLGRPLPARPSSDLLREIDGYLVVTGAG